MTWFCLITWQTKNIPNKKVSLLQYNYYNTYDHQTWQGGNILWRAPTHKVTWSLNHVPLWRHVTY